MRRPDWRAISLATSVAWLAFAAAGCDRLGETAVRAGATAAVAGIVTLAEVADAHRAAQAAWTPRGVCGAYPNIDCYVGPGVSLEDAREHTRRVIDEVRKLNGAGALDRDFTLDLTAQSASKQLARDHRPHGQLLSDPGSCPACGESQSDPDGFPDGPVIAQLDAILDDMMQEGEGGTNHDNLLRRDWHHVGVGVVNGDGPLYLTLDFTP
jgi:hypothetical protein